MTSCSADGDRRLEWAALAVVTLIGFGLRWSYLGDPIRVDEGKIAAWVQSRTFREVAAFYENIGNHVLHTLLVDLCHSLFGLQPWSIRLPALLPGAALIPATYLVGAALFSRRSALLAAGLAAGAPFLALFSVISRGYVLQSALLMVLAWLLLRLAESRWRGLTLAAGVLAAGVVGALALHTLPTTLFALPGLYAGAALRAAWGARPAAAARGRTGSAGRLLPALVVTGGLALLLYLPVFLGTEWERIAANRYTAAQPAALLWERLVDRMAGTARHWAWDLPLPAQALWALVAGAGLLAAARRRQASSALFVVLVITSTVAFSVALRRVPPVRGYLFLMPFFLLLPAVAIDAAARRLAAPRFAPGRGPATRFAAPLLAVLLAAAGAVWTWSGGWLEAERGLLRGRYAGAESAMRALAAVVGERDVVAPPAWPYRYYAALHDLPIRFAAPESGDAESGDIGAGDVDNVYLLVLDGDEVSGAVERYGLRDRFGEPRPFGVFPDIRVFVVGRQRGR